MPYWHRTVPDPVHGGYLMMDRSEAADPGWLPWRRRSRPVVPNKYLVTQARMVYGFSLVHRLGLGKSLGDYLHAAELGYRFMVESLLDREHGGFMSVAAPNGDVVDSRKLLYGNSIAIYGLVEFHRATNAEPPLRLALEIFRSIHSHCHDSQHGGWIEHADRGFRELSYTLPAAKGIVGVAGLKSADAHLHWMEALAELYQATGDQAVGESLHEVLQLSRAWFFPPGAQFAQPLRTRDWRSIGGSRYDLVSYGHELEFAWLMIRAQRVLGLAPAWDHFHALVGRVLHAGWDFGRGGVYFSGRTTGTATDRRKVWWTQAEALAALVDGWEERSPEYEMALSGLVDWILTRHVLSADGIWITSTDELGKPLDRTKAGPWKGAYHDVRAMTKYIAAFS